MAVILFVHFIHSSKKSMAKLAPDGFFFLILIMKSREQNSLIEKYVKFEKNIVKFCLAILGVVHIIRSRGGGGQQFVTKPFNYEGIYTVMRNEGGGRGSKILENRVTYYMDDPLIYFRMQFMAIHRNATIKFASFMLDEFYSICTKSFD
jgi:hypothetical protein